jgi:signal transduction histidine kinase
VDPTREAVHDLSNVLLVIQAAATMLERRLPEGSSEWADAVRILEATAHRAEILRRLRLPTADVAAELAAALPELEGLLGPGAELELDVADGLPHARVHPWALRHIVVGLVRGAAEVTKGTGRILVSAAHAGETVVVTVSDPGPATADREPPSVSELFGSGTEPALASVRRLAAESGAELRVSTTSGGGAAVSVYVPAYV